MPKKDKPTNLLGILIKGPGKRGVADTLLPTQMFPRLPARATFVANTNFVSGTQKMFLILFRNILCPQQMLRARANGETFVSATMCPRLSGRAHCCRHNCFNPFARAGNICCRHKFCVRDTKNVSDFVQKHFVSATKKDHEQQCVGNNVSSFTRALIKAYLTS